MSGTIPNQFKSSKQNDEDDEEEDEISSSSSSTRPNTRNGTAGPSPSAGDFDDDQAVQESSSRTNLMSRSTTGLGNSTCVQVALRIRPLLPREVIANARECISVAQNEPQVWIAGTHAFTYDNVFDKDARQDDIFETVAKPLVDGILEGYNATILAYGQTGSGKTFTMGTGFDPNTLTPNNATQGILPRCITYLYTQIQQKTIHTTPPPDFKISVQFTELYNEEVIDLLSDAHQPASSRPTSARSTGVKIHEQANGQIYLVNINTKQVSTSEQTLETLKSGALNRTTASTNMNDQSSRSHAIFTIHVTQNRVTRDKSGATDIETLSGKFHFVDLAGSERLKRTMATGDRAREGIAINSGLLALGNVISALGDKSKKSSHVPYRDSKLTRLLQDSLGGNSRTLMIACVSPNELDFVETLNTMKYANRAKNIKNRVILNQDKSSRTISLLKDEISRLQAELMEYKRGKRPEDVDDLGGDVNAENIMLLAEVDTLKCKLKSKQDTIDKLTSQVARLQALSITSEEGGAGECDLTNMVSRYLTEIEDLRARLYESEAECEKLRAKQRVILKNLSSPRDSGGNMTSSMMSSVVDTESVVDLLSKARSEVKAVKEVVKKSNEKKIDSEGSSDEEEEEEDDEDEEEEENPNIGNYAQLADLTQEINTKERLIEELENSQLRLESLKQKYEEKLSQLATRIKLTEDERDAVMSKSTSSVDKSKEYEHKITSLQQELKKWNNAKKEHAKLLKNQTTYESQIGKLRREIDDMKRMKVKLMNQVKNENLRHREVEKVRMKEITQLRKEARVKDIKVRKLESDQRMKEMVLKRKLEEVEMLKGRVRGVGRGGGGRGGGVKGASPVKGKHVWSRVQGSLMKDVSSRGAVASLEREMVNHISRRTDLNERLSVETDPETRDSIESNLRVVEHRIREVQEDIVSSNQIEEESGVRERKVNIGECKSVQDYAYVFDKIYEQLVSAMTETSSLEGKVREVEGVNRHLKAEVDTLRELLHHMYLHKPPQDNPPSEPVVMPIMAPPPIPPICSSQSAIKARRRLTSTTQELLGSAENVDTNDPTNRLTFTRNRLTQSLRGSKGGSGRKIPVLTRQDTYSVLDKDIEMNKTFVLIEPNNELTLEDVNNTNKVSLQRSVSEIAEEVGRGGGSRRFERGQGNGNVKSPRGNAWLQLTRQLEGHTKPILCLSSTETTLVSGSKDGSARVWDLETSYEVACFDGHPHNVTCVCHVPDMNLVLTGSSYQVRVYDLRSNEVVKVMSSSGTSLPTSTTTHQPPPIPSLPQSTTLPRVNELPPGEKSIHSIQRVRNYFYTSFGERIKIWDLRKLGLIGTLSGKHMSSVMCITGQESGLHGNDWVVTGSKDHSVKVYEYEPTSSPDQITNSRNLNPPHYDGIECLLMRGSALYSGSRDTCIKKWDLQNNRMTSTVTNAHSGWITGLCGVPKGEYISDSEFIVSCSRDGQLKLWDCGGREFREVCRYEGTVGMDCVESNSRSLFFGGGSGGGAGNSVSCCQINERLFNLIVQYREYQQQQASSSSSPRDRSYSSISRISLSPSASPKFRRKGTTQVSYLASSSVNSTSDPQSIGIHRLSDNFSKNLYNNNSSYVGSKRGGSGGST